MAGVDKKGGPPKKTLIQKLANPEILLFLLTVFAMVLLGIISSIDITGVKTEKLTWTIKNEDSSLNGQKRTFTIVQICGYAILFLIAFYMIVAAIRLMIRKKRQVQN